MMAELRAVSSQAENGPAPLTPTALGPLRGALLGGVAPIPGEIAYARGLRIRDTHAGRTGDFGGARLGIGKKPGGRGSNELLVYMRWDSGPHESHTQPERRVLPAREVNFPIDNYFR